MRDPGGGERRRGAAEPRRRPSDRTPRGGPRPRRLRPRHRRDPRRPRAATGRCRPPPSSGPSGTRGDSPRRGCAVSTAISRCANGCRAHDRDLRRRTAGRTRAADRRLARRRLRREHDHILAVDRSDDGTIRWYVRMRGDDKEFTTVWLTLEPAHACATRPTCCRRRRRTRPSCTRTCCAATSASSGRTSRSASKTPCSCAVRSRCRRCRSSRLDRALGTLYATVEQCFQGFLRIAFASRFAD